MVMLASAPPMTVEEFEAYAALPENRDRKLGFINGEMIEVPSNTRSSQFGFRIGGRMLRFIEDHPPEIAHVTGEAAGYTVFGERYALDVGVVLVSKQPQLPDIWFNPAAPDLAVEVDYPSSTKSERILRRKLTNYLAAGAIVWLVFPELRIVEVYQPGHPVRILTDGDTLTCPTILPGFSMPVSDIFK